MGRPSGHPFSFGALPATGERHPHNVRRSNNDQHDQSKTDRIRAFNDAFRRTFVGGAVMVTQGVEAMPLDQRRSLLQKVRSFETFSEDNDPHAEHDFGAVDEAGERFFWKIDYYDRKTEFGSPDPADPARDHPCAHDHEGGRVLSAQRSPL